MFNIPFRCYDCKENIIPGNSVKLKCDCIVGWCQACAKKSVLGLNFGNINAKSYLKCPICPDKIFVKDTIELIRNESEKRISRMPHIDDVSFRRNIFLEQCIEEERTGESNIGRECIVCSVNFVDGNSVQVSCSCVHALCQLCVREQISRVAETYNQTDGSFKCPSCNKNAGNLHNVGDAKALEDEVLIRAWKKFMRARLRKDALAKEEYLLLLWVGIVYIPDSLIESSDLDAAKVNDREIKQLRREIEQLRREMVRLHKAESLITEKIKSTLESNLKTELTPLLKFTMNADQASVDMLRLEIARLFLWRERGGPKIPFGPLAKLKVPRNRLLERWALKKLDECRLSDGKMNIISSTKSTSQQVTGKNICEDDQLSEHSDYYDIKAVNNNGPKIFIRSGTIAGELYEILMVIKAKKVGQYLEKEEQYLRTYCQGPIHSALPVTLRNEKNNHPVAIEDDGDDEDDEFENALPSAYYFEQVEDSLHLSHDEDEIAAPSAATFFDAASQDYIDASSPAATVTEDNTTGEVAEQRTDHMIVETELVDADTLIYSIHPYSVPHVEPPSDLLQSPRTTVEYSSDKFDASQVAQNSDSAVAGDGTAIDELQSPSSNVHSSTEQLEAPPVAPQVEHTQAKKSLTLSYLQSRGLRTLKRVSTICLEDLKNTQTNTQETIKRSKLVTGTASPLPSGKVQAPPELVVDNASTNAFNGVFRSDAATPSNEAPAVVRKTILKKSSIVPSQLDGAGLTAAMVFNPITSTTIAFPASTTVPNTADATTTSAPKQKVKKRVTFKDHALVELEPDRPKEKVDEREEIFFRAQIRQQAILASEDLTEQYRDEVLFPTIQILLSPRYLENALIAAVENSEDKKSFNIDDMTAFKKDCEEVFKEYELSMLNKLQLGLPAMEASTNTTSDQSLLRVPAFASAAITSVDKVFEAVDFNILGSFALFVVTPRMNELKADTVFLSENENVNDALYPVEIIMPTRAVTSLSMQPSYTTKLRLLSSRLMVSSLVGQLDFQLKFKGKINHIRSSVDDKLYLQKNKTLAHYNIPKGSKIELRPIVERRRFHFHRRRLDRPTPKEDAMKHALEIKLQEIKSGQYQQPPPRQNHTKNTSLVHTGEESTESDDSSEEGMRKSSKKRGKQRKGLSRGRHPNHQGARAPTQNQQQTYHPPLVPPPVAPPQQHHAYYPPPPPPPATAVPPVAPPQQQHAYYPPPPPPTATAAPPVAPPQHHYHHPQPYQQQRYGGRDSGDRGRDRDDRDKDRDDDGGRDRNDYRRDDNDDRVRDRGREDRDGDNNNYYRDRDKDRNGSERRDGNNRFPRNHNGRRGHNHY